MSIQENDMPSVLQVPLPFVDVGFPKQAQKGTEIRAIGDRFQVEWFGNLGSGIPFGCKPMLILSLIVAVAKRDKTRTVVLGRSTSQVARSLGYISLSGSNTGEYTLFKKPYSA